MSYIAFDLDALNVVPSVASAAGLRVGDVSHGLLTMWAWCFREETDVVSAVHVRGFFGADCADALAAFGFLSAAEDGFKVRGADRYLRIKQAQREGGKKGRAASLSPVGTSGETSRSTSRSTSWSTLKSEQALTPSTEHRTPNTEHQGEEAPPPPQPVVAAFELKKPDIEAIDGWGKEDFWRAAEITRRDSGFPPERWPNPVALSRWWGEAQQATDTRTLADAFVRFTQDKHWRAASPPCTWAAFAKQYLNFLPSRGA